jgi:hypothetical protein
VHRHDTNPAARRADRARRGDLRDTEIMDAFPAELADLLNRRGRRLLERGPDSRADGPAPRLDFFTDLIDPGVAARCHALLDTHLRRHVKPLVKAIPSDSIWGMTRDYSETLGKAMRQKTIYFTSARTEAYRQAQRIGLIAMLRSASLAAFAEAATGFRLERGNGVQATLYEHGDYVGPHNDHHPEEAHLRDGYVDVHLSFVNASVGSQLLICESADGHLNVPFDATCNGSIAVYRLPFWHQATPMQGKRRRERDARRWLLMASYCVEA